MKMLQTYKTDLIASFCEQHKLHSVSKLEHLYLISSDANFIIDIYQEYHSKIVQLEIFDFSKKCYTTLNKLISSSPAKEKIIQFYKKQKDENNSDVVSRLRVLENFFLSLIAEEKSLPASACEVASEQMMKRFQNLLAEKKTYYKITVSHDEHEMGVAFPQIDNFNKVVSLEKDDYRNYMKSYLKPLQNELDFDNFLLKDEALETDFISSRFLATNGFFVGSKVKKILQNYKIANGEIIEASAIQSGSKVDLFFIQVMQGDIIDYTNSVFVTKRNVYDKIQNRFEFQNAIERFEYSRNLTLSGSPDRLYAHRIQLSDTFDLFKTPFTNDYIISEDLLIEFKRHEVTGYVFTKPDYEIL